MYTIRWSEEDKEWVATNATRPKLSGLGPAPFVALWYLIEAENMADKMIADDDAQGAHECLQMVRETLEVLMGEKLDRTPNMFLNDAIRSLVQRERRKNAV